MNGSHLYALCDGMQWPEVRKYVSSDAAEEDKKRNIMYCCYDYGQTCLHLACDRGAPDDIIKSMLDIGEKELVMMTDIDAQTALHSACYSGASYYIINMLIEVGGKDLVMAKSKKGDTTALYYLCRFIKRHDKVAEKVKLILLIGDANLLLSAKNDDGQTPLKIATDKGASNIIKKLLIQHEGGEGTVVQSQPQSSKRRRVENAANISSVALNTNQAEDDDAAMIAGQLEQYNMLMSQYNMLMSRYMATRKELRSAKAQNVELKQEIDDLATRNIER